MDPPSCIALAQNLEQLLSRLSASSSPSAWQDVQLTAEKLADILRIKDGLGGSITIPLSPLLRLQLELVNKTTTLR
jgi:hypothetical protein